MTAAEDAQGTAIDKGEGDRERSTGVRSRIDSERLVATLFGDPRGLALFLGTLLVFGFVSRVGFFIIDSYTVATTLVNVAAGSLEVTRSPFSLVVETQPGMVDVGGRYYGRNYGQVFVAVPVLLGLRGLAAIAEPRLVLLGVWAVAGLGFGRVLGDLTGRPQLRHLASALVALVFAVGVAGATAFQSEQLPIVALQIVTLVAVGVAVVAIYRLVALLHGRRAGTAAGVGLLLGSPLAFWATIPKRHTISAAAIAVSLYLFAVSRRSGPKATAARAGTYAVLGLFATVHAFEAAVLVAVLIPVDLATAPSNDRRSLAAVAAGFAVSLLPLFLVNILIAGNPLKPPRMLPAADTGATRGGLDGDFGGGGAGGGGPLGTVLDLGNDVLQVPMFLLDMAWAGSATLSEPERLWHVFVRSGYVPGLEYSKTAYETVDLAVLESFPLLGALAWLPIAAARRLRNRGAGLDRASRTDVLAAAWTVSFVLVYLSRLPLHSMITARYILPVAPLGIYALARLGPVRAAVGGAPRWLAGGFVAATAAVLGGMLVAIGWLSLAVGEAVQLHALVALAAAAALGAVVATRSRHREERAVALALALAGGVTASFLLLSGLVYFGYGEYALDPARLLADLLPSL